MAPRRQSSPFTKVPAGPFGPPLIGALLRIPWEAVRRRMLQRLHERGFDDLDTPHVNVFQFPGPQGAKPSELAARLGASKQSVNHLLGQLERLGYLERRDDPQDLRSRRIHLTGRGRSAVMTIRDAVAEIEREWGRRLGSKRLAQLRDLLRALCDGAGRNETMNAKSHPSGAAAAEKIMNRIQELGDWRGETLARVRQLIHDADPEIEEEWKWEKPSSSGVPVWSHEGGVCTGEPYKQVVKVTFFQGAALKDPKKLFNSSLEGNTRRAIDIREGETIDAAAFKALIRAAVAHNIAAKAKRSTRTK